MSLPTSIVRSAVPAIAALAMALPALAQEDPLPSRNDGDTRTAIVSFVEAVTDESGADFVPVPERIATFDNDGTLLVEHRQGPAPLAGQASARDSKPNDSKQEATAVASLRRA